MNLSYFKLKSEQLYLSQLNLEQLKGQGQWNYPRNLQPYAVENHE